MSTVLKPEISKSRSSILYTLSITDQTHDNLQDGLSESKMVKHCPGANFQQIDVNRILKECVNAHKKGGQRVNRLGKINATYIAQKLNLGKESTRVYVRKYEKEVETNGIPSFH